MKRRSYKKKIKNTHVVALAKGPSTNYWADDWLRPDASDIIDEIHRTGVLRMDETARVGGEGCCSDYGDEDDG